MLRGEGGTELARSGIELGGRDDPDARGEHLVGDEHDLGRMFGDLRGAPDERILTDYHGPVWLDAVFGTDVNDYPLGELVTDRGHDPGERSVIVGGPFSLQKSAEAGVLALQARGLGSERLGILQLAFESLFLAIVEGTLHALTRPLQRREERREDAARRLQYLGRAELDRVQGAARGLLLRAVALLDVDRKEGDADQAQDKKGRETACATGLLPTHVSL